MRATQSNFCSALDIVYSEPCSPLLNALITRFRESYSRVSISRESKRLKKSSSWLNSGNALIQQHLNEKFDFDVSPFYHVVPKHKLYIFEVAYFSVV